MHIKLDQGDTEFRTIVSYEVGVKIKLDFISAS